MKNKQKSLTKKDSPASLAGTAGSAIGAEILRVITDEIGGYEATHPAMSGATAAVHARVMIALGDMPRVIEWSGVSCFCRAGTIHRWRMGAEAYAFTQCSSQAEKLENIQSVTDGVRKCKRCFPSNNRGDT